MMQDTSLVLVREYCHTRIETISNASQQKRVMQDKNIPDVWHLEVLTAMVFGNVMKAAKTITLFLLRLRP